MEQRQLNPPGNALPAPAWKKLSPTKTSPPAIFPPAAKGASSTRLPAHPPGEARACNCAGRRVPAWAESQSARQAADSKDIFRQMHASDRPLDKSHIE